MQKLVINICYGGFSLSDKGSKLYVALQQGVSVDDVENAGSWNYKVDGVEIDFWSREIPRDCPTLIAVVEQLGTEADGQCAQLHIVEIPDDVEWQIEEYDGNEHVAEAHRTWHG